jgi:hypothetical protein
MTRTSRRLDFNEGTFDLCFYFDDETPEKQFKSCTRRFAFLVNFNDVKTAKKLESFRVVLNIDPAVEWVKFNDGQETHTEDVPAIVYEIEKFVDSRFLRRWSRNTKAQEARHRLALMSSQVKMTVVCTARPEIEEFA